uniref:CSON002911 protein n=1 Tax=Culicoides sonorensis TaxID=179676 RepID=A0A336MLL5_CULSO
MATIKLCGVKVIQNNIQVSLEYVFVSSEMTFDTLIAKISDGKYVDKEIKNAFFGKSEDYEKKNMHRLPIHEVDFSLVFLLHTVETTGHFLIELKSTEIERPKKNALELMMTARQQKITPERNVHKKPGPRELYLDGQQQKFVAVKPIPPIFVWKETFKKLLDSHGHIKKYVPNMSALDLLDQRLRIERILSQSHMKTVEWEIARSNLKTLHDCIGEYINYLSDKSYAHQQTPSGNSGDSMIVTVSGIPESVLVKKIYEQLDNELKCVDEFQPVNLYAIAPIDKVKRFHFLDKITLGYPVQIYRNPKKHFAFIWKVPNDDEKSFLQRTLSLVKEIDHNIEKYHDEVMKNKTVEQFKNVYKYNRTLYTTLYTLINGDEAPANETLDLKIKNYQEMIESGVSIDEIFSIEKLNNINRTSKFENFWAAAQTLIDDADAMVPDERRHGTTSNISPMFTSQRDFYDLTMKKMTEMFPNHPDNHIPTIQWFRLQFTPFNLYVNTAKKYTGRFNACLRFQTRLLRKHHVDHHYGAKIFGYFKEFAQSLSGYCSIYLRDDKASIPVGPVNTPTEAVRRQRKVLNISSNGKNLSAVDHDHCPQHLVPSVTVKIVTEENEKIHWYGGLAHVSIKCAIFEASNAFRHAAEFVKLYDQGNDTNKIVFMYSDGGTDHNTSFIQVQLSLIATFLHLNLDGIVAARTPPYLSVLNPAERVMSVLNLGLYGLALCQDGLEPNEEELIKNFTTKIKWRNSADTENKKSDKDKIDIKNLAKKATKNAVEVLESRFKRLTYGGENIVVMDGNIDETINKLFDVLKKIDANFDWKKQKISKAEVMSNRKFKDFFDSHVCELTYSYQVKKCNKSECEICQSVESPKVLSDSKPVETCKPSANKTKADDGIYQLPNLPFKPEINRARLAVRCVECGKGRILFAEKSLSTDERNQAINWFEDHPFVCGTPLFQEEHFLSKKIFQLKNNICGKSMTGMFFSCGKKNLKGYQNICSVCNEICDFAVETGDFRGLPRCESLK